MTAGPGLFGKLPEMGDFISRGVPPAQKRALDRWVTQQLATREKGWPEGGLRGLLDLGGALVLMVAVPSFDKVGRRFPLVAITSGKGLSLETANLWCNGAAKVLESATAGRTGMDETLAVLQELEPEAQDASNGSPALWIAGGDPQVCNAETIAQMFNSGGSCSP